MIKKSLCTWRLQYNRKLHRDFLIILYEYKNLNKKIIQSDQKVSGRLTITVQSPGAQIFLSPYMNISPRIRKLYRVIKESPCTWRLQYNHQVYRDFWSPCMNISPLKRKLYKVIKKSLCTWRLQCNHQVHRDFLITPYEYKSLNKKIVLGDQKVSVHLTITVQSSGAQRLFAHSV